MTGDRLDVTVGRHLGNFALIAGAVGAGDGEHVVDRRAGMAVAVQAGRLHVAAYPTFGHIEQAVGTELEVARTGKARGIDRWSPPARDRRERRSRHGLCGHPRALGTRRREQERGHKAAHRVSFGALRVTSLVRMLTRRMPLLADAA